MPVPQGASRTRPPAGTVSSARDEGALEQAEIQPPPETPVATPLVALGVERAIAPARVVASGDGLGHHRATLTAAPASDKDRGEQAPGS